MLLNFLGCTFLFSIALFVSAFLGDAGPIIFGGGAILALLWMLAEKLGRIEKKLDELLREKK